MVSGSGVGVDVAVGVVGPRLGGSNRCAAGLGGGRVRHAGSATVAVVAGDRDVARWVLGVGHVAEGVVAEAEGGSVGARCPVGFDGVE